jgi:phage-related protein
MMQLNQVGGKFNIDPCKVAHDELLRGGKDIDAAFNEFIGFLQEIADEFNKILPGMASIFNAMVKELETGINTPLGAVNNIMDDIKGLIQLMYDALNGKLFAMITAIVLPYIIKVWDIATNHKIYVKFGYIKLRTIIYIVLFTIFATIIGSLYNIYKLMRWIL